MVPGVRKSRGNVPEKSLFWYWSAGPDNAACQRVSWCRHYLEQSVQGTTIRGKNTQSLCCSDRMWNLPSRQHFCSMLNQLCRLRGHECYVSSIISVIPKDMACCQEPTHRARLFHSSNSHLRLNPRSLKWILPKNTHFEKSNTVAPATKLLRKLGVTVNLRFMVLGSYCAAGAALGLLAPAQYWQRLMWFLFALLTPL